MQGREQPDQRDFSVMKEEERVPPDNLSELVVPILQVNRINRPVDVHREAQEEANEAQEEAQP